MAEDHHKTLDRVQIEQLIDTAHDMAEAARKAILPHFRAAGLTAENKASETGPAVGETGVGTSFDPVTIADRAAEAAMRRVLAERRPQDAIFGEEEAPKPGTSGLTWVLDPIDGTRGFMSGTPTWGVLIALSEDRSGQPGAPMLGVIDQPYIGERFWGGFGQAQMQGPMGARALAVRQTATLDQAVIFTTFPEVGTPEERAAFERVARDCKLTRYGMDCYAYALLAAGQIDLVIEAGLYPYDIQAPIALIEAAGGIVTDWQGGPAHAGGQAIAAANPTLHAAALALLQAG